MYWLYQIDFFIAPSIWQGFMYFFKVTNKFTDGHFLIFLWYKEYSNSAYLSPCLFKGVEIKSDLIHLISDGSFPNVCCCIDKIYLYYRYYWKEKYSNLIQVNPIYMAGKLQKNQHETSLTHPSIHSPIYPFTHPLTHSQNTTTPTTPHLPPPHSHPSTHTPMHSPIYTQPTTHPSTPTFTHQSYLFLNILVTKYGNLDPQIISLIVSSKWQLLRNNVSMQIPEASMSGFKRQVLLRFLVSLNHAWNNYRVWRHNLSSCPIQ